MDCDIGNLNVFPLGLAQVSCHGSCPDQANRPFAIGIGNAGDPPAMLGQRAQIAPIGETSGLPNTFVDQMTEIEAAQYRDYFGGKHDTSGSSPFNIKTTFTKSGELKTVTTFDEYGRPHMQFGFSEGKPPHRHTFTYPINSQHGTGWEPIRGPAEPIQ